MYIDKDQNGNITALYSRPQREDHEFLEGAELTVTNAQLIAELEASVTARNLRGAALGDQYAIDAIQSIEDQISALR